MSNKTERWEVRADPDSDQLVNRAAALARVSTSAFVLNSAVEAAQRLLACETGSLSGGFNVILGYPLARLALDRTLHGQHLGAQLLVDALETIVHAATIAAGRLIVVDAVDESARAFYRHHDFVPIGSTNRLVMEVATARQALGLDEG